MIEFHPEEGYRSIMASTNELLMPWVDGINEKGLWMSCMHDPEGGGGEAHVEITKEDGKYLGRIVWLAEPLQK